MRRVMGEWVAEVNQSGPMVVVRTLETCARHGVLQPEAAKVQIDPKYVGFDIPNEFVVGYGLDYAERYRNLRCVGTLAPHVYGG